MTAAATSDAAPHWARPLHERHIDLLGDLAEKGMAMATIVHDQTQAMAADGPIEPAQLGDLTRAFGRASRATRLSVMLHERLIKDLIAFETGQGPSAAAQDDGPPRIVRIIVDPDVERCDRLRREAAERLDREDIDGLIQSHPVDELIDTIRHDLGLDPDGPLPPPRPTLGERIEERGRASARRTCAQAAAGQGCDSAKENDALLRPPDLAVASDVNFAGSRTLAPSP